MRKSLLVLCSLFVLSIFAPAVAQACPEEFLLEREEPRGDALHGKLTVAGKTYTCDTLENNAHDPNDGHHYPIAPGRYKIKLVTAPTFGEDTPEIVAPPRTVLFVHRGNYTINSKGCILPGSYGGITGQINRTQREVERIANLIKNDPRESWITISNYRPPTPAPAAQERRNHDSSSHVPANDRRPNYGASISNNGFEVTCTIL